MTKPFRSPTKILAVIEPDGEQIAIRTAMALAERYSAELRVISCVEPPSDLSILSRLAAKAPEALISEAVENARQVAVAAVASANAQLAEPPHIAVGKPYLEVIRHVAGTDTDFVVKLAQPLSSARSFLFASTDQHLMRKCPCPVWLQTRGAATRPKRIVAAVDLDLSDADEPETLHALNRQVLETAFSIAVGPYAEVIALHVWDAMGDGMVWAFSANQDARVSSDRYVNEILEARHRAMRHLLSEVEVTDHADVRLTPNLVRGSPERVLPQYMQEAAADVLVMGTVARTGLTGVIIGNTAENIVNSLTCPVLTVKPDGFVSPVLQT